MNQAINDATVNSGSRVFNNANKASSLYAREPVAYIAFASLIGWSFLVVSSLSWNIDNIRVSQIALATKEAQASWDKDQAFLRWAAMHGGIYVVPTESTPPNPYLAHVPDRDLVTIDGTTLTLINPVYLMRQTAHEYKQSISIEPKITGKNLINPNNEPDEWERQALERFENGVKEVVEEAWLEDEAYIRLIKPLIMDVACIKCHNQPGIEEGVIGGGLSVSVPLKPYMEVVDSTSKAMKWSHGTVWFLGVIGVFFYYLAARKRDIERYEFQKALQNNQDLLEESVETRTQALREKELEARENETRLTQIVDTAVEGVITTDETGAIETFNRAAEWMFGYKQSEVIGQNVMILTLRGQREKNKEQIRQYIKTKKANVIGAATEVNGLRKDGMQFPIELSVSELNLGKRKIFTGIFHDITARKEYEIALIKAKEEAEQANHAKSVFLSSMSHELRTPLNSILGFAQLLEFNPKEKLTKKQYNCVNQILAGGRHLLELINEVLDLAKIEAGKADLLPEEIRPSVIIEDCVSAIESMCNLRQVSISIEVDEACPTHIRTDYTRFKQLLFNLLSNAVKYNREGGKIVVATHLTRPGFIRVSVEDTGLGIPEEKHNEIFTPFSRIGAENSDIEGSGIGLSVCSKLVKLMEGEIGFESRVGVGSIFWFELPITIMGGLETKRIPFRNKDIYTTNSLQEIPRVEACVLYVEDSKENLAVMKTLIDEVDGLTLKTVTTAEEALSIVEGDCKPDLIIMDVNLPGVSGLDATALLKKQDLYRDIPVIALSALATKDDYSKGLDAGVDAYLSKPVKLLELIAIVNKLLRGQQ